MLLVELLYVVIYNKIDITVAKRGFIVIVVQEIISLFSNTDFTFQYNYSRNKVCSFKVEIKSKCFLFYMFLFKLIYRWLEMLIFKKNYICLERAAA